MQDSITKSKFICLASIFFCFGIYITSLISFDLKIFFIILIPLIFFLFIYSGKNNIIFGLLILSLLLGGFVSHINEKESYREEVSIFPVFREKLSDIYFKNLPGEEASFLSAMIIGDKSLMTEDLKEKLNNSGLRHVAAISGLHITLFIYLLLGFISLFKLEIKKKYFILFLFILFYLFLIGFPISAIRASLMMSFVLVGKLFGRINSRRNIFLIAAIMLAFNPSLLSSNAGFQLSFGAVIGILYLSPIISNLFKKIIKESFWRNFLSVNIGIQLMTIPILIINFSEFSAISILSNFIILPLIPSIIGLGVISSLLGFIPLLNKGFFLLIGILLRFILFIIDILSSLSFATINFSFGLLTIIIYYLIIFVFWNLFKNEEDDFLTKFC